MLRGQAAPETGWWSRALWDVLLTIGTLGAWELRFGRLGPQFNSDVAVHGAMVLRPIDLHFIYYWGQSRLGSLVPAWGKLLRWLLALPAAEATQLAVYLCSALALWLMLGVARSLPAKLLLAGFCAFPSLKMAEILLSPGEPLQAMLLFGAWQLRLFLGFLRDPTPRRSLRLGFASTGMYWAAEPGIFLFASEALALGIYARPGWWRLSGYALAGALPFGTLISIGKLSTRSPSLFHFQLFSDAVDSLMQLGDPLAQLWPLLGAACYPLLGALAVAGLAKLWMGRMRTGLPSAFAVLAPVPLLAAWGSAVSEWYRLNLCNSRYLTFSMVVAVWASALALDGVLERLPARRRWPVQAAALGLTLWLAIVDSRGNQADLPTISRWQAVVQLAEQSGCQGMIGDYWHSYPYFTLSEGRLAATPYQGQYVRSSQLADATVRAPLLCAVPWWDGACKPELEQFGVRRRLRDEVDASIGGEPERLCRYDRE